MASVRCVENTFGIDGSVRANNNARNLRNLIEGADLVMSHITHFYHLAAADFIDFTTNNSVVNMSPWSPQYTDNYMVDGTSATGVNLILHYVSALEIRRKVHAASALFSGRHPIQAASVVGGITKGNPETITTEKIDEFRKLMNEARNFINTVYIPDVVTVANAFTGFWKAGGGCKNYLAYGAFDLDANGTKLLKTGVVLSGNLSNPPECNGNQTQLASRIYEGIAYSHYQGYSGLKHPFEGITNPNPNSGYSFVKAPRYMANGTTTTVCEVGPLARMLVTYAANATETVSQNGSTPLSGVSTDYTIKDLIDAATALVATTGVTFPGDLMSILGRHAARALEAKVIADAMVGGINSGSSWLDQLKPYESAYVEHTIPRTQRSGYGLTEAPRGALGHWMKIGRGRITHYQAIVPTTWNGSPAWGTDTSRANRGAAEQAVMDTPVHATDTSAQILNIIRCIHSFDFCGACAIHLNTPNGKIKVAIDPDGKVVKTEVE